MKNRYKYLVLIIGIVLLIAVVIESFWAYNRIDKSGEARKNTFIIIDCANELLYDLLDAEHGQRGFLLTQNESYLEPYLMVNHRISGQVKELRRLVEISGNTYVVKHLDILEPLIDSKMNYLSRNVDLIRNSERSAAISNMMGIQGKPLMDSILKELTRFKNAEKLILSEHDINFKTSMSRMFIIIIATGMFTLIFAISFTYFLYREAQYKIRKIYFRETENLLKKQEEINTQLHQVNVTLELSEEKLAVTLNSIGDAVLATDSEGRVTLLNSIAEKLTGWTFAEAAGHPVDEIFHIINEETRLPSNVPVKETLANGTILGLANHTVLISRDGSECAIADSCAPIRSREGKVIGAVLVFRDVSDRNGIEAGLNKALEELKSIKKIEDEAREYSESIINTVREPLIALDKDLRVVSVSRSFYEVFKVNPEDTMGQLIYDLGNKQWNIPKLRELLEKILPQKASFDNYEVEHDFTTIGRRTMLLNARQIQRESGKERIILLAIEDITERKEIETGLEKTRKELEVIKKTADEVSEFAESIINTVREPLISLDQDLRVVAVSRSFYEFFKVNPEETVGQLIYDLGNKQWDIPKLRELLETILPQETSFDNYEVEHDFASIGKRIMLLNARQIQRGLEKERIILLAIEDITERKQIEAGLEKTRKELEIIKKTADEVSEFAESIINTVREPLISLDQDLRVVTASRSFYEVFKVKPEETVGQLIYDLGNKQWDIPSLRKLLETILPQEATFDNYEVEHDFASIGKRIMLLNARQIQRESGKERIILLAIEDITERRDIEIVLEKAHEELNELAIELKRTSRVKSEFLANMSHELRTPLNSINGFSEVLYDEIFGPLNEKQKKYVHNVLISGKHLLSLINQILDTAKVEAGKMKLVLSSLPMKSLLNEISMLIADMAGKKNLIMHIEIADDLPDIEGDDLKVKEIIYNLLSNAVKFTPEGGEIGMKARRTGSMIEVVVWDSGIGISSENMEKIFEGFFRVDTPYSRVTEGTGLGLPLSKKLVELHNGRLFVTSDGLMKGTSVCFTLPIKAEAGV